jgi:DNA modification methylase
MTASETIWHGCYDDSWEKLIVNEAYAHPAKFSAGLIDRIYTHGFERGWWHRGGTHIVDNTVRATIQEEIDKGQFHVVTNSGYVLRLDSCGRPILPSVGDSIRRDASLVADCFGGIGGGAIYAAYKGLRHVSVELEPRFVELFKRNVELHSRKWDNAGDPTPVMIQGDSREFAKLVGECGAIVTSPPYAETINSMKQHDKANVTPQVAAKLSRTDKTGWNYGTTPGQIGALKAGNVDAVITSPPYADSVKGEHGETETAKDSRDKRQTAGGSLGQSQRHGGYGCEAGNIGNLKVAGIVTSPPFGATGQPSAAGGDDPTINNTSAQAKGREYARNDYGSTPGQLGNTKGDSYWAAMAVVYDQCRLVLKPGGVLCVVVKDYIKDGKRVPLCDQTLTLLEHVGFIPVERIRAMLVKEDRHPGLFGDDVVETKERKSFFRRLAEKKGSPRIDWEEVLIVRKNAT